jgi:hypothetical protein
MMLFPGTKENFDLSAATISRLKADSRIETTRASLLRMAGYGLFSICLGLGCGAALSGYSVIKKAQSSSAEIADILLTAINGTAVTVKGEVKLDPDSTVTLEPGATVSLDPAAKARLAADRTVELQDARPHFDPFVSGARPKSGKHSVTSYTVFKEVSYDRGAVITAWTFASSEHNKPARQRCYYTERADHASASTVTELAVNGQTVPNPRRAPIDATTAATNCVWFDAPGGV